MVAPGQGTGAGGVSVYRPPRRRPAPAPTPLPSFRGTPAPSGGGSIVQRLRQQALEPVEGDGGGDDSLWGRGLGILVNNPLTQTALKPLQVLDIPRRLLISTIQEGADALNGGDASFSDWWDQVQDPEFGFGDVVGDTGNKWVDRLVGFAGDVALDPLTYLTFGASQTRNAAGKGGKVIDDYARAITSPATTGRNARLNQIAEAKLKLQGAGKLDDEMVEALQRIGSHGYGGVGSDALEKLGMNRHGMRLQVPFTNRSTQPIRGTEGLAELVNKPFAGARGRLNASDRVQKIQDLRHPLGLEEPYKLLTQGEAEPQEFLDALTTVALKNSQRTGGKTWRALSTQSLTDTLDNLEIKSNDDLRRLLDESELGEGETVLNKLSSRLVSHAKKLGVEIPELEGMGWLPHVLSREFQNLLNRGGAKAEQFMAQAGIVSKDLLPNSGFMEKRLLRPGPEGPMKLTFGDTDIEIRTGSINEINDAIAEVFPELKSTALEMDPRTMFEHYIESASEDIGSRIARKLLAGSADPSVRALPEAPEPEQVLMGDRSSYSDSEFYVPEMDEAATEAANKQVADKVGEEAEGYEIAAGQIRQETAEKIEGVRQPAIRHLRYMRDEGRPWKIRRLEDEIHDLTYEIKEAPKRKRAITLRLKRELAEIKRETDTWNSQARRIMRNKKARGIEEVATMSAQISVIQERIDDLVKQIARLKNVDEEVTSLRDALKREVSEAQEMAVKVHEMGSGLIPVATTSELNAVKKLKEVKELESKRKVIRDSIWRSFPSDIEGHAQRAKERLARYRKKVAKAKEKGGPVPEKSLADRESERFLRRLKKARKDEAEQIAALGGPSDRSIKRAKKIAAEREAKVARAKQTPAYQAWEKLHKEATDKAHKATFRAHIAPARSQPEVRGGEWLPAITNPDELAELFPELNFATGGGIPMSVSQEQFLNRKGSMASQQRVRRERELGRQVENKQNMEDMIDPESPSYRVEQRIQEGLDETAAIRAKAGMKPFREEAAVNKAQAERDQIVDEVTSWKKDLKETIENKETLQERREAAMQALAEGLPRNDAANSLVVKFGESKKGMAPTQKSLLHGVPVQPMEKYLDQVRVLTAMNPDLTDETLNRVESLLHSWKKDLDRATQYDMTAAQQRAILKKAERGQFVDVVIASINDAAWELMPEGDIVVSRRISEMLKHLVEVRKDPGLFGQILTAFTNFFKTYATLSPGFHVRNGISAVFMNSADGVPLRTTRQGLVLWRKFMDAADPEAWLKGQPEQVQQAFQAAFGSGTGGRFFESGVAEATAIGRTKGKESIYRNPVTTFSQKVGQDLVEGPVRLGMALDSVVNRGMSSSEALERISRIHFDYSQVSRFDEQAKRLIPFWTFMSRNLPMQITQMWAKPKTYLRYQSLVRNFAVDPVEGTPDYILENGAWNTGLTVGGKNMPLYLQPDLAHLRVTEDMERLERALSGDDPAQMLSDFNPFFTAPLEYATGTNFFTGRKYEDTDLRKASGPIDMAMLPLMLIANQAERTSDGFYFREKGADAFRSLAPPLDRAIRFFPGGSGTGGDPDRLGESRARFLGVPIRTISDRQIEGFRRSKYYEELEKRAMAKVLAGG